MTQQPATDGAWTPSALELERRRVRRTLALRRVLLASAVTVVFFAVVGLLLTSSAGWPVVRATFFDADEARAAFPSIIKGFGTNVVMFLVAEPLILLLGALVAIVRSTRSPALFPLRFLAVVYTDVFRGVPTILLVFLLVFGVPALQLTGVPTSMFWLGLFALVLSYGAYVAEVFRSGIESIHPSQVNSARALGLKESQTMRYVVLPQAARRVVPPLLNDFVSLQKDTALVGAVGVFEGLFAARDYANYHFNYTPYLVTGVLFVALTVPLARFTDYLGRRAARRMYGGVLLDESPHSTPLLRCAPPSSRSGTPMTLLRLESVRKSFGERTVLRDVDLSVAPHDVVCLIGASGSGKSTLLRCTNLLEQVDDGRIWFGEDDITDPRVDPRVVRRRIGMVFQAYNLFPHMSVLDNLTLAPRVVHDVPAEEARTRAVDLLARFGLADKAGAHPDQLSGGQQQRVALARALVGRPELLLLDEVTSALDPELVGEMLAVLRDLAAEGTTMVLATHEMAFARDVATSVCFLHDGAILEQGPPDQVLGDPREERTRQFLRRVL